MKETVLYSNSSKRIQRSSLFAGASLLSLLVAHNSSLAQQAGETPVPPVSVTAPTTSPSTSILDGSTAAGYRYEDVTQIGPFANMKILDTPYTVNSLSSDFLENTQVYATPNKILDILPGGIQYTYTDQRPVTGDTGYFRGSLTSDASGQRIDGLPVANTNSLAFLEPFSRVEALSSVSGFMYGVGSATGLLNYVLKRPLPVPFFADVTTGVLIGSSPYGHLDTGGHTADGRFGYRFNIVGQTGETDVQTENVHKYLVAGAFDIHLSDSALLQFDVSHSEWEGNIPVQWGVASGVQYSSIAVPDPSKLWSQPWSFFESHDTMVGTNLTLDLAPGVTSRSAVRYEDNAFSYNQINGTINANNTYNDFLVIRISDFDQHNLSGYQYFDFKFNTLGINHKLTFGFLGSWYQEILPQDYSAVVVNAYTNLPFTSPQYLAEPKIAAGTLPQYISTQTYWQNAVLGDEITFNQNWSALLGVAYSEIEQKSYTPPNVLTTDYTGGKLTPTAALLFKPTDWVTAYGSYVQGLQQGTVVQGTQFTNNGAVTPPYLRDQYEIGVKATHENVLYTIAFYQISSALAYSIQNPDGSYTYVQSGRQENRGIDTSATGTLLPGLRMLAGVSYVDPKVSTDAATPQYVGKTVQGAANWLIKDTIEYDLPFLRGLTWQAGAYYTSGFWGDQLNTNWIPGHVTFDTGLRYTTMVDGHPLIMRFTVSNLADAHYWTSVSTVSEPRRFAGTLEMKF